MTHKKPLARVNEAAEELGVPARPLRDLAERRGFLIRFGRSVFIARDKYGELIEACQEKPKEPVSIKEKTGSGTSVIAADTTRRPAQEIAERLKRFSRTTSQRGTGHVAQLQRKK